MEGATVSILIPLTVVVVWLPALSTAVPVTELAPWAETVVSGWQVAMPLTASEQAKCTVTGVLYHPLAFGSLVALPVIVGADLSTRTVKVAEVSTFPARSTLQ